MDCTGGRSISRVIEVVVAPPTFIRACVTGAHAHYARGLYVNMAENFSRAMNLLLGAVDTVLALANQGPRAESSQSSLQGSFFQPGSSQSSLLFPTRKLSVLSPGKLFPTRKLSVLSPGKFSAFV